MSIVMAIDPGEKRCGMAYRGKDRSSLVVETIPPAELLELIWGAGWNLDPIIVERFQLYPDKAVQQIGSQFGTVEVIGAIKWISKVRGINLVTQGADVQRVAKGHFESMGYKEPKGVKRDGRSALLHLFYWWQREGKRW